MFVAAQDLLRSFSLGGYAVRSSLPLVLAALAIALLCRRSAAIRHRIWLLGLVASLVVPMATWCLPKVAIPLLPSEISFRFVSEEHLENPASTAIQIDAGQLPKVSSDADDSFDGGTEQLGGAAPDTRDEYEDSEDVAPSSPSVSIEQAIALIWLSGVFFGGVQFLAAFFKQSIILGRLREITDERWNATVAVSAQQMGLSRCPRTFASNDHCVPSTSGILNPILVVPADWKTWSDEQRDCILLHELAHIHRRDVASQCTARFAMIAHWFNPLVWYAAKRLRVERELASDDCVLQTGCKPSKYAEQLLATVRRYRPSSVALSVAMASSARLDDRVVSILDPAQRREPVGQGLSLMTVGIVTLSCFIAGGVSPFASVIAAEQPSQDSAPSTDPVWKEIYTVRYEKTLPVSAIFSPDGERLLTGDATGEVMDLNITADTPTYNWKTNVGGSHPAIAYSPDGMTVYSTTTDGVGILNAASGKERTRIVEKDSQPIAIDVFPIKSLSDEFTWTQIVFGNARGYFVKTWATGNPDKAGTISTSTLSDEKEPTDSYAVPLAVDPKGRSAIMTGPIDGTGQFTGAAGNNVLWAYVCGDYDKGSPGNRIMQGHTDTVVSAAWSKNGTVAVTGDAAGRVIQWNATTMKESHRRELGGRVAAVAISDDGERVAAYVLGARGRVLVWDVAKPDTQPTVIHTEFDDLSGKSAFACLDFSPEGDRIAGCAGDQAWLEPSPVQDDRNDPDKDDVRDLVGRVRVWELSTSRRKQPSPKQTFSRPAVGRSSFVIPNQHSIVITSSRNDREGSIGFLRVSDGKTQSRFVLGDSPVDKLVLSADREWIAFRQHKPNVGDRSKTLDIVVRNAMVLPLRATIRDCQQLLDLSKGGETVAVVQNDTVSLWNGVTAGLIKRAPFRHTRIDAAKFSPDGKLLAISDRHTLILWRWQQNEHARFDLGCAVSALAFSPDGRLLAEGPAADRTVRVRDLETQQIVRSLTSGQPMSVPDLRFTQGGRVLIAGNKSQWKDPVGDLAPRPRIFMWDMDDGSLVQEISTPGPVTTLKVSPNELHLIAQVASPKGEQLMGWRLDGAETVPLANDLPPATEAR